MIAAAAPVAVAGHFGISEAMAKDMQAELAKDADRTLIAMPGETFLDKQSIWFSVADVAGVWAEELHRQHPMYEVRTLLGPCQRLAKAIDSDLTGAVGAQDKVLVEVPKLRPTESLHPALGASPVKFELVGGVEQKTTLWNTRTRVGYIQEEILVGEAVNEARRGLFGLRS